MQVIVDGIFRQHDAFTSGLLNHQFSFDQFPQNDGFLLFPFSVEKIFGDPADIGLQASIDQLHDLGKGDHLTIHLGSEPILQR